MRAACYESTGPAAQVLRVQTLPDPVPGPGELRVHLRWSGVNPSDVKMRAGRGNAAMPFARIVPHSDGMGVVDAVGAGVDTARLGERVWTWNAAYQRPNGTAAQYVVLPQAQAVALPDGVADEAGACLGIPALTALHALLTDGGVAGQRVLIAGGAGAVGHYAVQFARLLGARDIMATTSSAEKGALAQGAGATLSIDYRSAAAAAAILDATGGEGVDRVVEVDLAANATLDLDVTREGGTWVVYGSGERACQLPFLPMINKAVLLRFFSVYRLQAAQRQRAIELLTNWLAAGRLQHLVAARLPLAEIAAAHDLVAQGRAVGNVVLSVD